MGRPASGPVAPPGPGRDDRVEHDQQRDRPDDQLEGAVGDVCRGGGGAADQPTIREVIMQMGDTRLGREFKQQKSAD